MCGANVPAGQACNSVQNIASPITPTCVTDTMPAGTGGAIVDGTYVLASQTYYNASGCSTVPISETIAVSAGCIQGALGDPIAGSVSTSFVVQGNNITWTLTCLRLPVDGASLMTDGPTKTFTATPTTLTMFTHNEGMGSSNPDRVEVFTKR